MKKYLVSLIILLALVCISVNVSATEYISDKLNTSYKGDVKMIYGFEVKENKITVKDILEGGYFAEGINVYITDKSNNQITDTSKGCGTGTQIVLSIGDGLIGKYKTVIYGDITGDGQITPVDALTLIKVINKKIEYVDEVCEEAGRITTREEGKTPSAVDALAIIKHLNNKYEITQNRSAFYWDNTSDAWKEATTKNELNFKVIAKDEAGNRIEGITWEVSEGTLNTNKGRSVNWVLPNVSNTYKITAKIDENNILEKEIKYIAVETLLENDKVETEEIEIKEDGDEDGDGLSNIEEYELETDINYSDTDADGLSDYDEVKTYKTNPKEKDTDEDSIADLNEILLELNPLKKDSDGDGISDQEEQLEYTAKNDELGVNIEIKGDANIADTQIDTVELDELDNVDAIVSPIYSFYTEGKLQQAEVEISYDEAKITEKGISEENLSLYYFDPSEYTFEKVNTQVDVENNKIQATLEHFSMYVVADETTMVNEIKNQILFVIDNSGSMYTPEQAMEKDTNTDRTEEDYKEFDGNDPEYKRLELVSKLIDGLDEDFKFGAIKFTADDKTISKMGSSKEQIKEALEKIKTDGENFNGTWIAPTIYSAVSDFDNKNVSNKYIVLITDGDDTAPSQGIIRDWAISRVADRGIKIITIAIGSKINEENLIRYSDETGGKHYHLQYAEDLEDIYKNIYAQLNLKREAIPNEDAKEGEEEYLVVADSGFIPEVNGFSFGNYRTSRSKNGQCYGMAELAKKFYTGDLELTGNVNRNYIDSESETTKYVNFNYDLTSLEFFNNFANLINYEFKSEAIGKIFKSSSEEFYDYDKLEKDLNAGIKKPVLEIRKEYKAYIEETNGIMKTKEKDSGDKIVYNIYVDMDELTEDNLKKFPDFQLIKAIEFFYMSQYNKEGTGADSSKVQYFEEVGVEALENTIEKINSGIPVNIGFETNSTSIISTIRRYLINTVTNHAVNGIRVLRSIGNPNEYKIAIYNNNNPGETQYLTVKKVKTLFGNIKLECYEIDGQASNIRVEK